MNKKGCSTLENSSIGRRILQMTVWTQLFSFCANTDYIHEALSWPHIKEVAESDINPVDHLLFELYLESA